MYVIERTTWAHAQTFLFWSRIEEKRSDDLYDVMGSSVMTVDYLLSIMYLILLINMKHDAWWMLELVEILIQLLLHINN